MQKLVDLAAGIDSSKVQYHPEPSSTTPVDDTYINGEVSNGNGIHADFCSEVEEEALVNGDLDGDQTEDHIVEEEFVQNV